MLFQGFSKVVVALFLMVGSTLFLQAQEPNMMQQQGEVKTDYSDAKVDKFAKAALDVEGIMLEYQNKMQQSASDKTKLESLKVEANEKMEGAIKDRGLSVNEYQNMVLAARSDSDFRNRVAKIVQGMQ